MTESIEDFWESIASSKEADQLYSRGLKISSQLTDISKDYKYIETKLKEKMEFKMFIQMATFYKYVVQKPLECE